MNCSQCPFKAQSWSELGSHARTVHRWKPSAIPHVLDTWDSKRLDEDRQVLDMDGYSALPKED